MRQVVIDSGKMKEMQFDASTRMRMLVETWVSQANAMQRRGRAGRVQAGACFHIYSHKTFSALAEV